METEILSYESSAHPYQRQAVEFCLERPSSYLQLNMGTGKTLISLEWMREKIDKGVLIICPLRAVHTTWPEEIEKWNYPYSYTLLHGKSKLENIGKKRDVYIINFEGIKWLFEAMKTLFKVTKRLPFRSIVIDEGSMIKSPSTKRFKILKKLVDVFQYKLILSGTPAPQSLLDLWSQYFFLDMGERLCPAYYKYRQKYFYPTDYKQFNWAIRSSDQKKEIYDKIKDITFRLDGGDSIKLPERTDNIIKLKLTPALSKQYKELEKKFFLELEETKVEVFNSTALSMKMRQFIQGGMYTDDEGNWQPIHNLKLEALREMVEIADGNPMLVPIQFKFELELIRTIWPKVPAIVGGVPAATTAQHIRDWNKGTLPLLLCHPASLSHAVNMQSGGCTIIWYGLTWSSEQYQQLNARLHRQGQEKPVIVHHMVIEKTIDTAVMAALKSKIRGQNELLSYIKNYHKGGTYD